LIVIFLILLGVPIMADSRFIDFQELQGILVIDPFRNGLL